MTASGAGQVDIGEQSLDYRVTPLSLGGIDLDTDVPVPLLITGPWSAPKFRLDLESLAEAEAGGRGEEAGGDGEGGTGPKRAGGAWHHPAAGRESGRRRPPRGRRAAAAGSVKGAGQWAGSGQQDLQDQLQDEAGKALLDLLGGGN